MKPKLAGRRNYAPITCSACGKGSPAGQAEVDALRQMREAGWRYRLADGRSSTVCGDCAKEKDW